MTKTLKVEGMMCKHCRKHVEDALNSIDNVKSVVTLDPPQAEVEFIGNELSLEELQAVVNHAPHLHPAGKRQIEIYDGKLLRPLVHQRKSGGVYLRYAAESKRAQLTEITDAVGMGNIFHLSGGDIGPALQVHLIVEQEIP